MHATRCAICFYFYCSVFVFVYFQFCSFLLLRERAGGRGIEIEREGEGGGGREGNIEKAHHKRIGFAELVQVDQPLARDGQLQPGVQRA